MVIQKKRKEVREEPVQKKKKLKSSRSQIIIQIEKDSQFVIKTEDDQLETKKKVKKKENLKDECLDQLELKNNKKKGIKKKVSSELAHSESFVNIERHLDSEPQEESEEQIKTLKKKKKKVQCHSRLSLENNQSSDVKPSRHHADGTEENEFTFKKRRKITALYLELDGKVTKKKKKEGIFSLSSEDIQDSEHKQSEKVCKKQRKYISQQTAFMGKPHETDVVQNDGKIYVRRQKRKKGKSNSFLPLADNQDICGVPESLIALGDFRKRQRKNSQEITLTNSEEEDAAENSGSIKETKRTKNRSKCVSFLTCEDYQDHSHRVPDEPLQAQQEAESEEEELSGKKSRKNIKGNNEVIKKKKKNQKKEEDTTYPEGSLNNDSASKSQIITLLENNKKKERKKNKEQAECVTGDVIDKVLCDSNHMTCDRKRKKRTKEPPQDFTEDPVSKANTKKIRREDMGNKTLVQVDDVGDVTIVQEKKGNCDEVSIDKVRWQALQDKIGRESGKTKVFSPKMEWDTKFGQWSTAAFRSSEEEKKFFRLMGGFKKGSVPVQNLSAATNKPNMALNREGEEKLQQALKMEFDKAMDLKQHRRIGLGFQPAANKKVYIDKYTSRSIKFED
ncbi:lysine-rich nucleolar protein 1 isoform X2 [Falco naumanni]|uniref:lysine-rich nucleolar protein 1 isoform X2 n=1 Tax=Falco naumanni TaxID=148594 RepID=UPI001ADE98E5|nr:lysine-rich nucleolar protein 1 isoform X2 [Falco naumanni]